MRDSLRISIITAVSIFLTLFIGRLLGINSLFYAGIASAVVSQTCYKEVFRLGIKRIYGTIVGAGMGILFYNHLPQSITSFAVGIFIIVYICSEILKAPANMACIVFLAISTNLDNISGEFYAIHRVLDTSLGVISALVVAFVFRTLEDKIKGTH